MEPTLTEATEAERLIDIARLRSIAEGKLYDIQILNLKCIPLVVFGDKLSNEFKVDFDNRKIHFDLTGEPDYSEDEAQVRLEHLVKYVQRIIGNFEVTVLLNKKGVDGKSVSTTGKAGKKPNGNRKKRISKVRKRK